ncbi:MAG: HAD family phosphatase [Fimbriimonadaceae bacterium]|nr:HAD family phosphatase [Fimbriimonadaceae bacterium]QYK59056.1 MAG: HAD family phosphatase [Fimbriimonadaceae bacterium]
MSALLLDLDGTLIDSEPWYKRVELETLHSLGVPVTLEEMMGYTGTVLDFWLAAVNERHGSSLGKEDFLEPYRPKMVRHLEEDVEMFPDAQRLLDRISGPMAIVTSSLDWYVDVALRRFPVLKEKSQAIVCAADVQRGKPDPEPYLVAAARLATDPSTCTVVEDSQNGVLSGLAAGCRVVAITRHGTPPSGAHDVLGNLDDLATPATV